ncbi:MAG: asparagine synthase (glutamine-hydrolyzing), partial [Pseudobdellovibrio sp.]
PMSHDNGNYVLSYNGEIFNFPEIKKELEASGVRFKSHSDTEVLLHALVTWGEEAIKKLNGMWSFVFFDKKQNKLIASRDRAGIKPLYYFFDGQTLALASEIKAILRSGVVRAKVDPVALDEYFTFQNVISERTLFDGIKNLEPGYNLIFDLNTHKIALKKYWDIHFKSDNNLNEQDCIDLYLTHFEQAVKRSMISDVPVGATISGGIDSSSIVAFAGPHVKKLNTFTGYFENSNSLKEDRSFSERDDARIVADVFKTNHHERLIGFQDQIDTLPMIVWHMEDPKVAMSYTFYNISHLVSSQVTVNLSGTGGDELFAGYPWRYDQFANATGQEDFRTKYFDYWSRLIKAGQKSAFFTDKVLSGGDLQHTRKVFDGLIGQAGTDSFLNQSLYFEFKTFLQGMLMVEDKLGMAFSIETRFPYLDTNLMDLAARIPDQLKYKDGLGKYICRKALEKHLPPSIIVKKKQGFTPPDYTWYRREMREYIESFLLGRRAVSGEYIRPEAVRSILARLDKGEDLRLQIWSLLFFEGWCRTFLKNDGIGPVLW